MFLNLSLLSLLQVSHCGLAEEYKYNMSTAGARAEEGEGGEADNENAGEMKEKAEVDEKIESRLCA